MGIFHGDVKINILYLPSKLPIIDIVIYLETDEKTRNVLEMAAFSNMD